MRRHVRQWQEVKSRGKVEDVYVMLLHMQLPINAGGGVVVDIGR
jgi:hypothetical protein